MDIIPTIRPGYDCHLHLVGKVFTQSFIPLLSPPHLTIPIDIPYIIPNTEIDKQNKETTTQTNPIKINFNKRAQPLEYTSCLSLEDLTKFMNETTKKEEHYKTLETGGIKTPSDENDPVQACHLPLTTGTRPNNPQIKTHKIEDSQIWASNPPWTIVCPPPSGLHKLIQRSK